MLSPKWATRPGIPAPENFETFGAPSPENSNNSDRPTRLVRGSLTRLFIAAIVGARISMGLFFNVTGPTLPTLAANCGTTVKTLSWIFTVRAVAQFIGAATATKIFKILNPLIAVTISVFGIGLCLIFIPVVVDFWLLCILVRFLIIRAFRTVIVLGDNLRTEMQLTI